MNYYYLQYYKYVLLAVLSILVNHLTFAQFQIPEKPEFQTSVYDYIGLLSPSEKSTLENKLIKYSDTTSTQIVVAIIASTNGENINYLGANWGEKWGIGQAQEDNGVLILLAKEDRTISINTAKGVEHLLTDALSKRIIENVIIPQFREGNYYTGLDKGTDAIFAVMQGEYQGTRVEDDSGNPLAFLIPVIIIIVIFILISRGRRGGRGGNRSGAGDLLTAIILSNLGRSGMGGSSGGSFGGGGGFGGGGFGGGFGGGSFGGGGASGSW